MRKIFLDVGGYEGFSSLAALDPIFAFDRVFCFEPAAGCLSKILRIQDPRLVVVKAGLSNRTGTATLYHPGSPAGSVFSDAPAWGADEAPEHIDLISAGEFFRIFIRPDDRVFMKLNCEGSELDVLESLLDGASTGSLANVLIDLDARKIPSQRPRVKQVMQRVKESLVPFFTPEDVQYGMVTNYGGVRNWLITAGAADNSIYGTFRSAIYNLRVLFKEPEASGYHKKIILDALPWLGIFAKSRRG